MRYTGTYTLESSQIMIVYAVYAVYREKKSGGGFDHGAWYGNHGE